MADFAVNSVTITADGWSCDVVLDGEAGQQGNITYDLGTPGDTGTSNFYMTVTREGYSGTTLGTIAQTVYATAAVRQPYPNEASLDEVDSASDLVVRLALSDYVYNDDKNGGAGTSGTDPAVTINAGCFTNSVDSDQNTAFSANATNNSTLDYPVAFGQWDELAGEISHSRLGADFQLAFNAFHRHGIAAVRFDVDGQTSTNNETETVTTKTSVAAGTSLELESFRTAAIDISGFTQGEVMHGRARLYPLVGDADSVMDTESYTTLGEECRGRNRAIFKCNKTDALTQYAFVDTGGDDSTGVVSATRATAKATPYLSITQAIEDGATNVIVEDGTHDAIGDNPASQVVITEWAVVEPESGATVTLTLDADFKEYRVDRLMYKDLKLSLTSGNRMLEGNNSSALICFLNVEGEHTIATRPGVNCTEQTMCTRLYNCTGEWGDGLGRIRITRRSSVVNRWMIDGSALASDNNRAIDTAYRLTRSTTTTINLEPYPVANQTVRQTDNFVCMNNQLMDFDNTSGGEPMFGWAAEEYNNKAIIGNIFEHSGTQALSNFQLAPDVAGQHHIVAHNTIVGQQYAPHYNSTGTSSVLNTKHISVGNVFSDHAVKGDTFGTPSGNRIGNWSVLYSVGYNSLHLETTTADDTEFYGLNATTTGSAGFVDDQSSSGSQGGNGDYTPDTGSALLSALASGVAIASFDMNGVAIPNDGTGAIGALQIAPVSSGTGNYIRSRKRLRWLGRLFLTSV